MENIWNDPGTLARRYAPAVFRLAYARTSSRTDAEDIMQEVFLRLIRAGPVFASEEHAKAWLLRVTVNCTKTLLHSPWRRRTAPLEDLYTCQDPEESAVCEALDHLDPKYRAVVHLH